jgi:3-methylcrotonyl-CoA carboxylase alpha subunit
MNTRLQVEHPVTEQITGFDLVRAQLLVASGEPLPWAQDEITSRGHTIEARIYAEDPAQGFIPQAGRLDVYREPRRPGVRVDAGVVEGDEVSVYYDPMIAKVIASAETRDLAIARLTAALREFVIGGVRTNLPFLIALLELPAFRAGAIDTAFLDREAAALAATLPESAVGSATQPAISDQRSAISWDPWNPASLASNGRRAASRHAAPTRRRAAASAGGAITAPMPATVIKVQVQPGAAVKKGDIVVVLEAMKMEHVLEAPHAGVIVEICVAVGDQVQGGAQLIVLGPAAEPSAAEQKVE